MVVEFGEICTGERGDHDVFRPRRLGLQSTVQDMIAWFVDAASHHEPGAAVDKQSVQTLRYIVSVVPESRLILDELTHEKPVQSFNCHEEIMPMASL